MTKDSPAAKAGLQQGDVIISYQGKSVTDVGDFRNQVSLTAPGNKETITVLRNGKRKDIRVKIGKKPEEEVVAEGPSQSMDKVGLTVRTLTVELARQFNIEMTKGVVVTEVRPGSVAAIAGITVGTAILQVNRKPVKSVSEFKKLVNRAGEDKRVLLLIRKGDAQHYVVLSW